MARRKESSIPLPGQLALPFPDQAGEPAELLPTRPPIADPKAPEKRRRRSKSKTRGIPKLAAWWKAAGPLDTPKPDV